MKEKLQNLQITIWLIATALISSIIKKLKIKS